MPVANPNFARLKPSYLFSEIAARVQAWQADNPDRTLIRLGIGDVPGPLAPAVAEAFARAASEMAKPEGFHGYGPEQGYAFLREAIASGPYAARGLSISAEEVHVSDGSKCDGGNILDLFHQPRVAIPDPVYPAYRDASIIAGVPDDALVFLPGDRENGFRPEPPAEAVDLVYLCFPNNPTGSVADKSYLGSWVDWARNTGAILLFDAAYESFIRPESDVPRSIFEIPGAREVAVEMRSLSKTAGFTGVRLAWTVIPSECRIQGPDGTPLELGRLWARRQATMFNGVSYPVQRAGTAALTGVGLAQTQAQVAAVMDNARQIRSTMEELGYRVTGGEHAPYVWVETGGNSWDFFDFALNHAGLVLTPGVGFGSQGEGHVRISAFAAQKDVSEAMDRLVEAIRRSR